MQYSDASLVRKVGGRAGLMRTGALSGVTDVLTWFRRGSLRDQISVASTHPVMCKSNLGASIWSFVSAWLVSAYSGLARPPEKQLPFLDFLRSIAILLVLVHHFGAAYETHFGGTALTRSELVRSGWSGVDLFFALSGFLIGGQLLRELHTSGTILIRRFVLRRGLRIWPLYYSVFLAIVIFDNVHKLSHGLIWADPLFVSDYVLRGIVPGAWSLCIEEQFYIGAPFLLMTLVAMNWKEKARPVILWGLFCLLPVFRAMEWFLLTGTFRSHPDAAAFGTLYYNFHTHCDGLIVGMIVAAAHQRSAGKIGSTWRRVAYVFGAGIMFMLLRKLHPEIFDFTGLALLCGSLVWFGVGSRSGVFRNRFFFVASRLSFGIYLNHQLLLIPVISMVVPYVARYATVSIRQMVGLGVLVISSSLVAAVTYFCVEHPFLMLRSALSSARETKSR